MATVQCDYCRSHNQVTRAHLGPLTCSQCGAPLPKFDQDDQGYGYRANSLSWSYIDSRPQPPSLPLPRNRNLNNPWPRS